MIVIIVILLFTFSLGDNVHPQHSKQCLLDTDVHELLMKMKCELVNMKEKLRAFEGKVDYNYIFLNNDIHFKIFLCNSVIIQ